MITAMTLIDIALLLLVYAWLAGLAALARRDHFSAGGRPGPERLAPR